MSTNKEDDSNFVDRELPRPHTVHGQNNTAKSNEPIETKRNERANKIEIESNHDALNAPNLQH
jgi:hypothetical protein